MFKYGALLILISNLYFFICRYIEIFRSSLAELRRASTGNGRPGPYDLKDRGSNRGGGGFGGGRNMRGGGGNYNIIFKKLFSQNFNGFSLVKTGIMVDLVLAQITRWALIR